MDAHLCIFGFAYLCIFCAYLCIWYFAYMCIFYFCIFLHIYAYYANILHISCLLICAYSCIFCIAYCCIFRAYFCIFKYISTTYMQETEIKSSASSFETVFAASCSKQGPPAACITCAYLFLQGQEFLKQKVAAGAWARPGRVSAPRLHLQCRPPPRPRRPRARVPATAAGGRTFTGGRRRRCRYGVACGDGASRRRRGADQPPRRLRALCHPRQPRPNAGGSRRAPKGRARHANKQTNKKHYAQTLYQTKCIYFGLFVPCFACTSIQTSVKKLQLQCTQADINIQCFETTPHQKRGPN